MMSIQLETEWSQSSFPLTVFHADRAGVIQAVSLVRAAGLGFPGVGVSWSRPLHHPLESLEIVAVLVIEVSAETCAQEEEVRSPSRHSYNSACRSALISCALVNQDFTLPFTRLIYDMISFDINLKNIKNQVLNNRVNSQCVSYIKQINPSVWALPRGWRDDPDCRVSRTAHLCFVGLIQGKVDLHDGNHLHLYLQPKLCLQDDVEGRRSKDVEVSCK